jgi:hypothetical protein
MGRLSSRETLFLKFILAPGLAAIWLAFSVMDFVGLTRPHGEKWSAVGIGMFLTLGLGVAYLFHRCYSGLKNVWLEENCLLISNGLRTERVPLEWAIGCSTAFWRGKGESVYAIEFDRETAFGSSVLFIRKDRDSPELRRLMVVTRWNSRKRRRRR